MVFPASATAVQYVKSITFLNNRFLRTKRRLALFSVSFVPGSDASFWPTQFLQFAARFIGVALLGH